MSTTAAVDAPVIDWFDPEEMKADPYPAYARMRELAPVVYVPLLDRYLLTTHAAVTQAEQTPEIFSSNVANPTMGRALGGIPMLRKNDPEHAAERGAVNPTLRPRQVTTVWSPQFTQNVEVWLDRLAQIGPDDADLNRDFAAPVASQNLIDLVGFPAEVAVDDMTRWSRDYIAGIGNLLDDPDLWLKCEQARAEVNAVLDELLPRLRREPDPSITSHLLQVGLPEEAVRANVHLTISGGMNEPQHMITSMVWALSHHPEQRAQFLADPEIRGGAFEETVRWLSPIGMLPRQTTREVEWHGVSIPAGAHVGLLTAAANREERVFPDPDVYDIHRAARGHLGFGAGVHQCAGRWAAGESVGKIAVPAVFERFPGLRIDESRPEAQWEGWVFRGLTSLPVTW